MIVFITGWRKAGKNLLRGLLDGHPLVFSIPFHDQFYNIFQSGTRFQSRGWLKARYLPSLRERLSEMTNYYVFEAQVLEKKLCCASIKEKPIYNSVDFDFYEFDRTTIARLLQLDPWMPQEMLETIYLALFEGFYPHGTDIPKIIATTGLELNSMGKFPDLFPDAKFINIEREPEGILASYLLHNERFMKEGHLRGRKNRKEIEAEIYSFVHEILSSREEAKKIIGRYPGRIMNVCFHEALANTEETMKNVANFLGIPFNPILTQWTWMGKEMLVNEQGHADKKLEKAEEFIPPIVRDIIRDSKIKFYKKRRFSEQMWRHRSKKIFSKTSSILEWIARKMETLAGQIHS